MTRRYRKATYRKHRRRKKITLQPLTPEAHAEALCARHQARAHSIALRRQWRAEDSAYRADCVAAGEAKRQQRRRFPLRTAAEITHRGSPH